MKTIKSIDEFLSEVKIGDICAYFHVVKNTKEPFIVLSEPIAVNERFYHFKSFYTIQKKILTSTVWDEFLKKAHWIHKFIKIN